MKVSEINVDIIKEYCGLPDELSEDEVRTIKNIYMPSAKGYIKGYTDMSDEEMDNHDDIAIAYMVIINEMYSKRDYTLYGGIGTQSNKCIDNILSMYAKNHIG